MIGTLLRRLPLASAVALLLASCAGPLLPPVEHHAISPVAVDEGHAAAWINAYRREHGLATLSLDPKLHRVAQAQADAMASTNQLSHTVAGSLPARLAVLDRTERAAAENVSAGYTDVDAALGGWRRSPEHDRNLLYAPMRRMGLAAAAAPGTRYKTFWSLVMTD